MLSIAAALLVGSALLAEPLSDPSAPFSVASSKTSDSSKASKASKTSVSSASDDVSKTSKTSVSSGSDDVSKASDSSFDSTEDASAETLSETLNFEAAAVVADSDKDVVADSDKESSKSSESVDESVDKSVDESVDESQKREIVFRPGLLAPVERGALVYYGTVGFPELKVGFREGMNGFELGAELGFDYALTDLWLVASGRGTLWHNGGRSVSMEGQLGAFGSFGAVGIEDVNRPGQGLRAQLQGFFTQAIFNSPLLFTATAKIPVEIPFSSCGLFRFGFMTGAGLEASLTKNFLLSFNFNVGPMLFRPYGGVSYFRFAFELNVGVGFRLF